MYQNLAVKYRPKDLDEVLGQAPVKTTIENAVRLGRIAHAYLLFGPRGCGKTTIARILAKTLNCHAPKDGKPCNKCASCLEIAESKSLDVLEIDAASHTQVDKVREVIIENVGFAPSRDKYKIYILDEVHMLSNSAFNALLKTIEEPPAHVVFIMATTEQSKVPVTIVSRCQGFRFRPIPEEEIIKRLTHVASKEKLKAEPEALRLIARASGGAMRDALTILDRGASFSGGAVTAASVSELLGHAREDLVVSLAKAVLNRDAAALHAAFGKLNGEGYDPLVALRDLRNLFSEAFFSAQGFAPSASPAAKELAAAGASPAALAKLSRKLNPVLEEIRFSDMQAVSAEIALFTLIEVPLDLENLVRRLEAAEGGAPAEAAPPRPQEKKSPEIVPPVPRAPAARPAPPPPRQEPAAAPVPAAPSCSSDHAAAWKTLLGQLSRNKPLLYNIMLSVRVSFGSDGLWKVSSDNKYNVDTVERNKADLEARLESICGSKVVIRTEKTAAPPPRVEELSNDAPGAEEGPEEDAPAARSAAARPPSGTQWVDLEPGDAVESDPEIKKLAKVFHGKITSIKKLK
ncbi:MAG TPA: DNA polymerase III subunit gamma/tau [Elusimicrobiales bacterium]|nr:DNA polymerase III subunit gamma/tau [Elusimicrobiales bacterium]